MVNEGLEDVKRGINANHILQEFILMGVLVGKGILLKRVALMYKQIFYKKVLYTYLVYNVLFFMPKRTAINTHFWIAK